LLLYHSSTAPESSHAPLVHDRRRLALRLAEHDVDELLRVRDRRDGLQIVERHGKGGRGLAFGFLEKKQGSQKKKKKDPKTF
jgi:hypothetical protein